MHFWKHFCTVTKHRWAVRKHCFQVGLYWQGLTHDLSKYSWTEFRSGIKFFQGNRSPNSRQREVEGYSEAWMHHKGRNKHHYEYWTDLSIVTRKYQAFPMPRKYFAEMVMDRIAACKTYHGKDYTDADALEYLQISSEGRDDTMMHPETKAELTYILTMLKDRGEKETFRFIKEVVLKGVRIVENEDTSD